MTIDDCADKALGLRHKALRNALYHVARRGWLDGWNRFYNLVIILGGTGSAAELTNSNKEAAFALGAVITLSGAMQLVMDFSGRARVHDHLQRRYHALMAEIEEVLQPTAEQCAGWSAEISRISADEPPTLRALDAIADNQATAALIGSVGPRLNVTRFESLTRHILPHNAGTFELNPDWKRSTAP